MVLSYYNMNYTLDIDRVKSLASNAGITSLTELCHKASVHPNSLTPYIKGTRSPLTQVVIEIAAALNVSAHLLLKGDGYDPLIYQIRQVVEEALPQARAAILFGSRARGTAKPYSDIDIGLTGGSKPISFPEFVRIETQIEERFEDFTHTIDLVNLDLAPYHFLTEIESDLKFLTGDDTVAAFFKGFLYGRKKN